MRYEITRLCFGLRHGDVGLFRPGEVVGGSPLGVEQATPGWVRFSAGATVPPSCVREVRLPRCRKCDTEFEGGALCCPACIAGARACAGERAEA